MKGFIEVTAPYSITVNVSKIVKFHTYIFNDDRCKIYFSNDEYITTKETYEQIKELIKKAQ